MTELLLAVVLFVGGHVFISGTGLRTVLVNRIGENAFRGLFSVFALGTLVWVVMAYRVAPLVPVWDPPLGLRWLTLVLVALGVWLVVAGLMSRNPISSGQTDRFTSDAAARGVLAITRHPFMWGVTLWAVGHLLARGDQAALIMFGGFAVLALAGSSSQDRKMRAKHGANWDAFARATSLVPFAAIIAGRAQLRLSEIGWRSTAVALVVFIVLFAGHSWVIGVSPLPS